MRRVTGARALLAALAVLVAACTPGAPDVGGGGPADEEAQLAHSQCMRERGYDWPDPTWVDGGWDLRFGPDNEIDFDSPAVKRDDAECQEVARRALGDGAPAGPADGRVIEEEMARLLEFAACMREQGIDYPDPQIDDGGEISHSLAITDEAAFQAAEQTCRAGSGR